MRLLDASPGPFDRVRLGERIADCSQKADELRQGERPVDRGVPVNHRRAHVNLFEAQYEIDLLEADLREVARAVLGEVDPDRPSELDCLRESRRRAERE
jgi:hypothetical protein